MNTPTNKFGFSFEKQEQNNSREVHTIQTNLQRRFGEKGVHTSLRFAKAWSTL